jgi:Bacteriophage HK97-gp10, putative tail-component
MSLTQERFVSGSDAAFTRIEVGLQFHKVIDYDRKLLRRAITEGAGQVRKEARRLISTRAISLPGANPGQDTGNLKRSIGIVRKGRNGGYVVIAPRTFKKAGLPDEFFYPAILYYGSTKRNIEKRNNFMADALQNKRELVRGRIREALRNSLVPR